MPAWEGRQGAEAALVCSWTAVPLSPSKINFPRLLGAAEQAAPLSQIVEPAQWVGGQPTIPSGGFLLDKKNWQGNAQVHPEVPTGILTQA